MILTRRNFIRTVLMFAAGSKLKPLEALAYSEEPKQKVKINIPSYKLTLIDFVNGNSRETFFPIAIGKGCMGRKKTPVSKGIIHEKRKEVLFRYGKSYPQFDIKRGDIIKWTNTFDENGNPKGYKMPYDDMRGLGMKLTPLNSDECYENFVIHSTTDEFTIGTPASGGCIRVGMEDMLKLYELVSPKIKSGKLENAVPVEISYESVELKENAIELHANVYNRESNPIEEFKKKIEKTNFNRDEFDYEKMQRLFYSAEKSFKIAHAKILNALSQQYPKNFIPPHLKEELHKSFEISEFLKN